MAVIALLPAFFTTRSGVMDVVQVRAGNVAVIAFASLGSGSTFARTVCATFRLPSSWMNPTKAISDLSRIYEGSGQLSVKVVFCEVVQLAGKAVEALLVQVENSFEKA